MGKIVALIESPLQLESFSKYLIKNHEDNKYILIARFNGNFKNDEMMSFKLIEIESTYENVKILKVLVKPQSTYIVILLLLSFFESLNSDIIIYGDYRSLWNKFIFNIFNRFRKNVIIDDGLATITIFNILKKNKKTKTYFFTSLKLYETDNIKLIDQSVVSDKLTVLGHNDSAIFIGSPLIEKNILTSNDYIKALMAVIRDNDVNIAYCYHRAESVLDEDMLLKIGFSEVIRLDTSIENAYRNNQLEQKVVIGFYSTAIINLYSMFKNMTFISYEIPTPWLIRNTDAISEVYSYLDSIEEIQSRKLN